MLHGQVKYLDWRAHKVAAKGKAADEELHEMRARIAALLGIRGIIA